MFLKSHKKGISHNVPLIENNKINLEKVNIYETPRKSFLVPPAKEDSNKGLRRGRSKYKAVADLSIEIPEKPFDEMNQEEFFCTFGLKRKD